MDNNGHSATEKSRCANRKRAADPPLLAAPRQDALASVVVFLVALPLCMGIAIASGVPVAAGLITGIVGGAVVGWFAGAPLQVSGPAAGLTVIVFELVRQHGLEVLGAAVLIGGAFQFAAGIFRLGRWFRAVSPAVIHGMLAGIGVLIFSNQFHVMIDDSPKGSGINNLLSIPAAVWKGLPWPEMGSTEQRRYRAELIKQFGALHEQQVQIHELLHERIPAVPAGSDWPKDRVEALVAKQRALSGRLASLVEEMDRADVAPGVDDPARLHAAAAQAVRQSREALDDLRRGRADQAVASQAAAQHSLEELYNALKSHQWAAKVGILTILTLLLWSALAPRWLKMVPAPLVAVGLATFVTALLTLPVLYVEVPDNLWSEVHFPSLIVLKAAPLGAIIQAGLVIAVVASAETLLCATAVDRMRAGLRTDYSRELAAQGVGNMICGALGALPMTGVIVRSAANVEAGARTRLATILHGFWLLLFVAFLAYVLRMIPTAALAAMLVFTGIKLVDLRSIRDLSKYGWGEVVIYAATVTTIVATDLLTGVLTGVALSAAKLLYTFSHLSAELEMDEAAGKAVLRLEGAATFIRLPRLATELEQVPDDIELHVDFQHLDYIDHACLDLLMNWAEQHGSTGGTLVIDWASLHGNFHEEARSRNKQARELLRRTEDQLGR